MKSIAISIICKNEIQHVERIIEETRRADHIYILDTGSTDGTFEKVDVRKRPGTVGICAAIMNHYNIDAVPHIICGGFTKRETEDALIDLQFLGIDNALILRGDAAKNEASFTGHYLAPLLTRKPVAAKKKK